MLHVKFEGTASRLLRGDFVCGVMAWVASETNFNRAADGFVHVPKRITMFLFPENLRYVFMSLTVTALFAASLLLGGDFVCGEMIWWRDKRISIVPWLGLANRRPLYIYSSTSVITRKGLVEKAVGTPRLQGDLYCGPLKSM